MLHAIYYPYIRVPDNPWFTRTLLYWDDVGAIVPYEYIEHPESLGDHMVALVRENLVTQVVPGMHLSKVPRFASAFLDHVDAKAARRLAPTDQWPKVHMEKLQGVAEGLCQRGLARKDGSAQYSPWYAIDPDTADDFMAYLAAVLGQIPGEREFVPVTDQVNGLRRFRFPAPSVGRRTPIRELVVPRLLPSPSTNIEAGRLAEFKARHTAELRDFRREIERRISEWALIDDDADRDVAIKEGVRELQDRVSEVAAMMERARWPRLDFGGFCTVVGSGITALSAVATDDLALLAGAGLSLAPAVYDAFRGADRANADRPLAYAVLAARKFS